MKEFDGVVAIAWELSLGLGSMWQSLGPVAVSSPSGSESSDSRLRLGVARQVTP